MSAAVATYAIRVDGHLDDHWSAWLDALELTRDGDGTTTLTIPAADQAQLHGVLARLRDIGAAVTELRSVAPAPARGGALPHALRTERLTLRPAPSRDAEATWRYVATIGSDTAAPCIGEFTLRRERARGQAELGWVLDPADRGRGHAAEAVRELLRLCFDELGLRRVTASCALEDERSWRLMERVGMRRELHALRAWPHDSGRWLDAVGYAILRDEWTER